MEASARRGCTGRAFIVLALLAAATSGCASRGGALASLDELGADRAMPLFWRVESTRGATLYLLGSVHLGPPGGWSYPPAVEQAFEDASALVVEVDPDELDERTRQLLLARYGMLSPGRRLQDLVSPGTWAALQRQVARSDLPAAMVDHMQPWLITNLLVLEATQRLGWSPVGGVDVGFMRRAGERSIVALESAELQMALFAALPPDVQELVLRDTLGRFDDVGDYVSRLVEVWRVGDEAALEAFVFESYHADPAFAPFFEALIFRRNHEMAARLRVLLDAEQHRGETVFVTVGAGHLVGPQGIPEILADLGYPVVQLGRDDLLRERETGGFVAVHR